MVSSYRLRLLYAALFSAISAIAGACMQQGEGDVCSPYAGNGGSSDCQDGYVCTEPSLLAPGTMGYRCCPGDLSLGTGVCALGTSMIPENPANPTLDAQADAADAGDAEGSDAEAAANDGSSPDASPEGGETVEAGDGAASE